MEWKMVKLGDVADYAQAKSKHEKLVRADYISTENMLPNRGGIALATSAIPESYIRFQPRDILISNIRPYFKKIWFADKNGGCSNDVLCIRGNESVIPEYLYYLLSQDLFFDYVMAGSKGTKMPRGDKRQIMNFSLSLPPLTEQKRIAAILASLDAKFENNNRINANLEAQVQALYKSWFVDFEPWGGKMPEDWKEGKLEDLAIKVASGGTPSSMNKSYYSGDIKWFSTKELIDSFLIDSEKHISNEAYNSSAAKLFPAGTVLMAIYAAPTVGRLGILTEEATFNQAAVGIIPKEEIGCEYLFLLLKDERIRLNNLASGAAQQNLNVSIVKNYSIVIPTSKVSIDFQQKVKPLFDQIATNQKESQRLAQLRDTLLPKLMKREIELQQL